MTQARQEHKLGPSKTEILEEYLDFILRSELLNEKEKTGAVKILRCLIYIKQNISWVQFAVDNKNDPSVYTSRRDQRLGVLRDQDGTSFHIKDFANGKEAEKILTGYIAQVETKLQLLNDNQRIRFAKRMIWDDKTGCLEARLEKSLAWAARALSSPVRQLDDIAHEYIEDYPDRTATPAGLKSYCEQEGYQQCIYQNKDTAVTDELLKSYAATIWGSEPEVKQEKKPEVKVAPSENLFNIHHIRVQEDGFNHTLNYHFQIRAQGSAFVDHIRQVTRDYPVDDYNYLKEETCFHGNCYVVSVCRKGQWEKLWGPTYYDLIKKANKLVEKDYVIVLKNFIFTQVIDGPQHILDHLLLLQADSSPSKGWTILSMFFRFQDAEVVLKLLDKASAEALNRGLVLQANDGWCALQIAFGYQTAKVILKLIDKASPEALNRALVLQNKGGWCSFLTAAKGLTGEVFSALVEKCDPVVLAKAGIIKPENNHANAFNASAQYQGFESFQTFLKKLYQADAKKIMNDYFKHHLRQLFETLSRVALYQSGENILLFLDLLDPALLEVICTFAEKNIDSYAVRCSLRAIQIKTHAVVRAQSDAKDMPGVLSRLAVLLENYQKSHTESKSAEIKTTAEEQRAMDLFLSGKALVKIIRADQGREDHFKEFMKHLRYPALRQKLRADKSKEGCKYVHIPKAESKQAVMTFKKGHIVKCRTQEENKQHKQKKPPYTHTKKHPCTLISKNLHTGLFGLHDTREVVGVVFSSDPEVTVIKAMLSQDYGTFNRAWVDTESGAGALFTYAHIMQNMSYTDPAQFAARIDGQPYVVNEVLAKFQLKGLAAQVIGRDTPAARSIARKRYQMERELGLAPILIYDPERLSVRPYTQAEQQADQETENLNELKTLEERLAGAELSNKKLLARLFSNVSEIEFNQEKVKIHVQRFADIKTAVSLIMDNVKNKKTNSADAITMITELFKKAKEPVQNRAVIKRLGS